MDGIIFLFTFLLQWLTMKIMWVVINPHMVFPTITPIIAITGCGTTLATTQPIIFFRKLIGRVFLNFIKRSTCIFQELV
jgi:hypothetical protein